MNLLNYILTTFVHPVYIYLLSFSDWIDLFSTLRRCLYNHKPSYSQVHQEDSEYQ